MRCIAFLLAAAIALAPGRAGADAIPRYAAVAEKSELRFVATQNHAPVEGRFTQFAAEIAFDPARPAECRIRAEIRLAAVAADYEEVARTLLTAPWFDAERFPAAVFEAFHCERFPEKAMQRPGLGAFRADGTLTLRGKTLPLSVQFVLERHDADGAAASGATTLRRTAFGIGQGEWAATDTVADEVAVRFRIEAIRKK